MGMQRSKVIFAWVMLAPALIYVLAIVAYPLIDTFILSFTDASLRRTTSGSAGLIMKKIANAQFMAVIGRTFVWTFFRC